MLVTFAFAGFIWLDKPLTGVTETRRRDQDTLGHLGVTTRTQQNLTLGILSF